MNMPYHPYYQDSPYKEKPTFTGGHLTVLGRGHNAGPHTISGFRGAANGSQSFFAAHDKICTQSSYPAGYLTHLDISTIQNPAHSAWRRLPYAWKMPASCFHPPLFFPNIIGPLSGFFALFFC
jgi:hypothetical protein